MPVLVHVVFAEDKDALRFFPEFFGFLLLVSLHHGSPYSYIILGMNNMPIGGHSSETESHPIHMNNLQVP
jgi:hypothetical protein